MASAILSRMNAPTVAPPSPEITRLLVRDLAAIVGPESVLSDRSEVRAYEFHRYTVHKTTPLIIVLPQTTEQVSEIVKLCNRLGVPFLPRGAGTGLSGGTTAACGGVVISTVRLNR